MNEERRKKLDVLYKKLEDAAGELEQLKDDEVDANDSKPEHLQDSAPGEALSDAFDALGETLSKIEEAVGG